MVIANNSLMLRSRLSSATSAEKMCAGAIFVPRAGGASVNIFEARIRRTRWLFIVGKATGA